MRRIYLFEDLECSIPYGQFTTQDWNPNEDLVTARDGDGDLYIQGDKAEIDQLEDPTVFVTTCIGVGLEVDPTNGPEITTINSDTIEFPIGEPDPVSGMDEPPLHTLYMEGGIKLEYKYYLFTDTHYLGIYISAPKYLAGYNEGVAVWVDCPIRSYGGGMDRHWLNASGYQASQGPIVIAYDAEKTYHVVFFEAPVQFKRTEGDNTFTETKTAFFPMFYGQDGALIECYNGYPNGYPTGITINCLNSDEIIPEPEEDQTSTGNNVFQDGLGEGLGVSDPAEHINLTDRNTAFGWGGTGVGLTYYKITPSDLSKVISEVWGGIFNMSSLMNTDVIRNCIVGAFALPIGITGDTATPTVWVGNIPISTNNTAYFITNSRLVSGTTTPMAPAERFTEDGWGDFNDFLCSSATLYLPFVGSINIDISAIARGTISVEIAIDQYNGNIAYWVYTTSMQAPNAIPILYGCYTGNCAVEMPISGFGYSGNLLQKVLNTGSQINSGVSQIGSGIGGIATGNIAGGASSAQAGGLNALAAIRNQIVDAFTKSVTNRGGIIDPMSACISPYNVTLQIRRARPLRSDTTRRIEGIPSATKIRMRDLTGYVEVKACDINTLSCSEVEKEEILRLITEGVYI